MFGGIVGVKTPVLDTWRWEGNDWERVITAIPPEQLLTPGVLVADGASTFMFGNNQSGSVMVWRWDQSRWIPTGSTAGPKLSGFGVAYDGQRMLVFGGLDYADPITGPYTTAEWTWSANQWTRIH
jgi:hypothetical protein